MAGMFRSLRPDEVQVRVQTYTKKGARLLVYKDSRADMALLDETVGPKHWKSHHSNDNKNCVIEIYDTEIGEWVSKEGVGDAKEGENYGKSLASDSFKRAGVLWGIGRELYNLHDTFVPCSTQYNEQKRCYEPTDDDKFKFYGATVSELEFDHDMPTRLVIVDNYGKPLYTYGRPSSSAAPKPVPKEEPKAAPKPVPKEEKKNEKKSDLVKEVNDLIKEKGAKMQQMFNYFSQNSGKSYDKVEDLTVEQLKEARKILNLKKPKQEDE